MSEDQAVAGAVVEDSITETQDTTTQAATETQETKQPESDPAKTQADKEAKEKAELQRGVQKRIDKITRARYEAEARARVLEERLNAIEARQHGQPQQQQRQADAMPKIDDYNNFDEYVQAKAEYISDQRIEKTLAEREQRQQAERAQAERAKTVEQWQQRLEKATVEIPDFEEVLSSSAVPMTAIMQDAIMESEKGPQLAYYLANNADEASKIAGMSPRGAILALGRIEERLANPTANRTTSAPPPLTPIGSSGKVAKAPEEMSQAEFEKWRKQYRTKR